MANRSPVRLPPGLAPLVPPDAGPAMPAAAPLTWRGRVAYTAAYAYICAHVGGLLANQSESLVALETYDVVIAKELFVPSDDEKLEKCLDVLARGLPLSTLLREKVVNTDSVLQKLIELCQSAPTVKARHHAAKAIDTTCALPLARRALVDDNLHEQIVAIVRDPTALLFVRKALYSVLTQLASGAARGAEAGDAQACADLERLAAAGVLSTLHASLDDPALARQRTRGALMRMCGALGSDPRYAQTLASLSAAERELVAARVAELGSREGDQLALLVDSAHAVLIEGGALMYMHTAAGGLVWGALESARARMGARAIVRAALVNSAVTCMLPITVVGGIVTAYHELEKMTNTRAEKFAMYTCAALMLYPGWRVMVLVEAAAPYWLGGHIVGFMSFFAWLRYTESDLLRSDVQLLAADAKASQPTPVPDGGAAAESPRKLAAAA
ncbi:hypothetical protein T492DRAFT_934318 [Pavlovales sp. CCMP2436]|nr:hypothetical protein T492DRAFT_934318 [Pavlovales sp. CCMP2436]